KLVGEKIQPVLHEFQCESCVKDQIKRSFHEMKGTIKEEAGKVNVMVESDNGQRLLGCGLACFTPWRCSSGWLERRSFRSELVRRVASELVRRVCFQSLTLC